MYLLDKNKLKIGDIILCRFNDRLSKVIMARSKSEFSHAMLYFRPYSVLEAAELGVHSENIQRILFENSEDAIVLRFSGDSSIIPKAIEEARSIVGTDFSDDELKRVLTHSTEKAIEQNSQFCTRYVAQPFSKAGVDLVENADYCSPNDLVASGSLVRIDNVLRKASKADLQVEESESGTGIQIDVSQKFIDAVDELANVEIQNFLDIDNYIKKNPTVDTQIAKALKDSGYLNLFDREFKVNSWRYDKDLFYATHKLVGARIHLALQNIEISESLLVDYTDMYLKCKIQFDELGFHYYELLTEHYKKIVIQLNLSKMIANDVLLKTSWEIKA